MSQDSLGFSYPTTGTLSGLSLIQDLNNSLPALATQNSGAAAPTITYAYMFWADTTTGLLKQRNAANSAWIPIGPLAAYPIFRAHAAIDQSITSGVDTKVTLGTVDFDTASNFASSRFTATVAGYCQFNGTVRVQATGMTSYSAYLYKNGALYTQGSLVFTPSSNGPGKAVVSDVIYLAVGDYVELYGNSTGGTSAIFQFSTTGGASSLSGCLVRPA